MSLCFVVVCSVCEVCGCVLLLCVLFVKCVVVFCSPMFVIPGILHAAGRCDRGQGRLTTHAGGNIRTGHLRRAI